MPRIIILDYGLGNLRSVTKAVEKVGATPKISSNLEDFNESDALILPGVGAFRDAQARLLVLASSLFEQIKAGKPILGICLGFQLLFDESEEGGNYKGLEIVKGKVIRFPQGLKIPHIGWNTIKIVDDDCALLNGVASGSYMYFVHSYYGATENQEDIVATTEYGVTFTSIVAKNNVYATQFHPEKSGKAGLAILKNFVNMSKR